MALPRSGNQSRVALHRTLFIIYINDIAVGLNNFISKFADDAKIEKSIVDDRDRLNLQET